MQKVIDELESKHEDAISYAKKYTRLLLLVIGLFAFASVLMKYTYELNAIFNPTQAAETALGQSSVPNGYWNVQAIAQIGLAILAIYFGQVIAAYSKYFYNKANYYERLILIYHYSVATSNEEVFKNEITSTQHHIGIGDFPKSPIQSFTEAVKNRSENKAQT